VTHEEPAGKNTPAPHRHVRIHAEQLERLEAEATCKTCSGTGQGKGQQAKGGPERTGLTKDGRPSKCGDCRGRGTLGPATRTERRVFEQLTWHRNNKSGQVTYPAAKIAEELNLGRKADGTRASNAGRGTVQRAMRQLASRGLIEEVYRRGFLGSVCYRIPWPTDSQPSTEARDRWRAPARQMSRTRATDGAHRTKPSLDVVIYADGAKHLTSAQLTAIRACDLCDDYDGVISFTDEEGNRLSEVCAHPGAAGQSKPVIHSVGKNGTDRLLSEMQQESKTVQSIEERL